MTRKILIFSFIFLLNPFFADKAYSYPRKNESCHGYAIRTSPQDYGLLDMESYREQKSYCERIRANQRAEEYRKYEKLSDYEKCLVDRTMGEKSKDFFSMIVNGPGSNTQKCNEEDFIPDCPDGYATDDSINYCYCVADWCKSTW